MPHPTSASPVHLAVGHTTAPVIVVVAGDLIIGAPSSAPPGAPPGGRPRWLDAFVALCRLVLAGVGLYAPS